MPLTVYRQDIKVIATAYVVADSPDEARKLLAAQAVDCSYELLEEDRGGFVRGADFGTLIAEVEDDEEGSRVTISPAITLLEPIGSLEEAD